MENLAWVYLNHTRATHIAELRAIRRVIYEVIGYHIPVGHLPALVQRQTPKLVAVERDAAVVIAPVVEDPSAGNEIGSPAPSTESWFRWACSL